MTGIQRHRARMAEEKLGIVFKRYQRKDASALALLSAEIHCVLASNAGKGWPRAYVSARGSRVLVSWAGGADDGAEIVSALVGMGCKIVSPVRPSTEGRHAVRVVRA